MYKTFQTFTVSALVAFMLAGCDSNNSASSTTLALNSTTVNDTLVIKVDDNNNNLQETGTSINMPPVAVATANGETMYVNVNIGEPVFFDANESYDPDGEIIQYVWSSPDNTIISTDSNFTQTFCTASAYEATLTVIDDQNSSSQARICVLAGIDPQELELIADAGNNILTDVNTTVTLEGHAVCKTGDFSYLWKEGNNTIGTGASVTYQFTEGEHCITFEITDNETGETASDNVLITVVTDSQP